MTHLIYIFSSFFHFQTTIFLLPFFVVFCAFLLEKKTCHANCTGTILFHYYKSRVNVQTLCIILDFYMEQIKRSRDHNIHEYDDSKRKKISCNMIFHFVV
jgi:hypothetical protein